MVLKRGCRNCFENGRKQRFERCCIVAEITKCDYRYGVESVYRSDSIHVMNVVTGVIVNIITYMVTNQLASTGTGVVVRVTSMVGVLGLVMVVN